MRKHAEQMRPKFEAVLEVLNTELGGLGIGSWYAPRGGYFISFDAMEGCAKEIVAKCKEAGVKLTEKTRKTAISELHRHSQHRKRWHRQLIYLFFV